MNKILWIIIGILAFILLGAFLVFNWIFSGLGKAVGNILGGWG